MKPAPRHPLTGLLRAFSAWMAGFAAVWFVAFAAMAQAREELSPAERKAAVIAKLPAYVTWPRQAEVATSPLVIGVVGEDPFDGLLEKLVEGSRIDGRAVSVKFFPAGTEIGRCDLLFVPAAQQARWLESRRNNPAVEAILTIGETDDFLKMGGMIRIVQARKYKLEIHLNNARSAGLTISSKLIDISTVVGGARG